MDEIGYDRLRFKFVEEGPKRLTTSGRKTVEKSSFQETLIR